MANRNSAETLVPTMPPIARNRSNEPASASAVPATPAAARTTTVECPSAKKNPIATGRCPSLISLRVTLSMAAMWSASTAWRSPNPYASSAVPSSTGWARNTSMAQTHTARFAISSSA